MPESLPAPSDATQHRGIAGLMCAATTDVLWPAVGHCLARGRTSIRVAARIGHGRATYCRIANAPPGILINYGVGMVADKLDTGAACINWKTAEEIAERQYYAGRVTPLHLFAHTVLHESSHALEFVERSGKRPRKGRHHGRSFYAILDRLHAGTAADQVLEFLADGFRKAGYPTRFDDGRDEQTLSARDLGRRFQLGQPVIFEMGAGNPMHGEVVRINRRSVTVRVLNKAKFDLVRVPPTLLRHR